MDVLYCGAAPVPGYPGRTADTLPEALPALEGSPWDILVWHWDLGPFPQALLPEDRSLVLLGRDEDLTLYRFSLGCGCRRVLISAGPEEIAEALRQEGEDLQQRRRDLSCRTLFQRYGDHLKMHLWYDLIVEGSYETLLEPAAYRLLLLQDQAPPEPQHRLPLQGSDSRTIISEIFPEAEVILALQMPWECVVLPGEVRRFPERALQCQTALAQNLGSQRKIWQSPPLQPGAIHGYYQRVLAEAARGQQDAVSTLVRGYIQRHLGEKLTRRTISEHLFFSPDYLAKVFRTETGMTLGAYVCTTRLERARELLVRTDLPVGTIAAELGYQNFSEFSQWFKKQTGMVPSQYRKLHKT